MHRRDVIIIGAGQAGLAMSHCLNGLGIDHVVLERGRIAERWRSATWDSLRLLTPNWMSRLPGRHYDGPDPDGFMTTRELIGRLDAYAASFAAPVESETAVLSARRHGDGYHLVTARGDWHTRVLVVATGECQHAHVPPLARRLPRDIVQVTLSDYRRPDALPRGKVLVVGASASGAQIADEIHASGRPVTLAVGRHTRLPRHYRGRDIMAWMDLAGVLDDRAEAIADLARARRQPSLQLLGNPGGRAIDLPALAARGVRLVGRLAGIDGCALRFAGDLAATTRRADEKMARLLRRIDHHITAAGLDAASDAPPPPSLIERPAVALDVRQECLRTVVWATGYGRDYPWLDVAVRGADGDIVHQGGVTSAAGLYVLGLRFLRRRKSSFLDGVGRDAEEIAHHVAVYLRRGIRAAA